jgi:hypothetical protein
MAYNISGYYVLLYAILIIFWIDKCKNNQLYKMKQM